MPIWPVRQLCVLRQYIAYAVRSRRASLVSWTEEKKYVTPYSVECCFAFLSFMGVRLIAVCERTRLSAGMIPKKKFL